jgi:preprotein translocase SecE subunit
VARDRKRSQGRRKRTPNSGGDPSRAEDMGLDDPSIDEAGLTDDVPTPDPLKNSSAEVDQAKAAEAGAVRGESGDVEMGEDAYDEDFEHAPDQLERDLTPEAAGRSLSGSVDPAVAQELQRPRKQRGKVITFLGHCVDELRRVQWPDRKQVGQATAVVLGFVVIAGSYLGLLDAIWKPVIQAII